MYEIIILPIVAGIFSQVLKVVIETSKQKFSWGLFNEYGGMPSSHTTFVIALLTTVGLYNGFLTPAFGVGLILAVVVIRDATGFRMHLGKQAEIINNLVKKLDDKNQSEFPLLTQRLGHTPLQVFAGAVIGILIPVLWYFITQI